MANAYHHSLSSAAKFGGQWQDYIELHRWFDQTKGHYASPRHRAILHSTFGIGLAEEMFGQVITRKSDGKNVPVRYVAERHVVEDCGFIPTIKDWLGKLPLEKWMVRGPRQLSRVFTITPEENDGQRDQAEPNKRGVQKVATGESGTVGERVCGRAATVARESGG